jgi:site-specific DNA-adenine methylase
VFNVLKNKKNELKELIELMPVHQTFWNDVKKALKNENHKGVLNVRNDVERAAAFLFLSNFGYMGLPSVLRFESCNSKSELLYNLEKDYKILAQTENKLVDVIFPQTTNGNPFIPI